MFCSTASLIWDVLVKCANVVFSSRIWCNHYFLFRLIVLAVLKLQYIQDFFFHVKYTSYSVILSRLRVSLGQKISLVAAHHT